MSILIRQTRAALTPSPPLAGGDSASEIRFQRESVREKYIRHKLSLRNIE